MDELNRAILRLAKAKDLLWTGQGQLARRRGRRSVMRALHEIRRVVDAHYPLFAIEGGAVVTKRKRQTSLHWRVFEDTKIKHVSRRWNRPLAEQFLASFAAELGLPIKPIVFDLEGRRVLGMHCHDRIRLNPDLGDEDRWRVLMHELAHYRVKHHRRAFADELVVVYEHWKRFLRGRPRAAG